jgi:hypothetical protein
VRAAKEQHEEGAGWTIAVMQPYFFPYAGYFRLLANVDEFVIYDCVQFQRRGRIHRTEVPGARGDLHWLTLPIQHCPRDTLIRNVQFHRDARAMLDERLAAFPWMPRAQGEAAQVLRDYLAQPLPSFNEFLEEGLRLAARLLGIDVKISRSSSLELDPALRAQDRILAVVGALGATRYLNLPGGRDLYEPDAFARRGVDLEFLPVYEGPHRSMLHSLMTQGLDAIRADVHAGAC